MNDRFHYDALVDDALRSVVRRVLTQVAERAARFAPFLHQLPQHRSRRGTAGLSARQVSRRDDDRAPAPVLGPDHRRGRFRGDGELQQAAGTHKGPFAALSAFVDPSVRFGLQFDRRDKATGEKVSADKPEGAVEPTPLPVPEKRPAPPEGETAGTEGEAATAEAAKPEDAASKVVKLDSFRKK